MSGRKLNLENNLLYFNAIYVCVCERHKKVGLFYFYCKLVISLKEDTDDL